MGVRAPGGTIQRVTALPSSPVDGQIVEYAPSGNYRTQPDSQAMDTGGYRWLLRYDPGITANSSAYPWAVLGGAPLRAQVATDESTTSAAYVDLATVGPLVTAPLKGVYVARYGVSTYGSSASVLAGYSAPVWSGHAADDLEALIQGSSNAVAAPSARELEITLASAGLAVKLQHKTADSGGAHFRYRWLSLMPVRVG